MANAVSEDREPLFCIQVQFVIGGGQGLRRQRVPSGRPAGYLGQALSAAWGSLSSTMARASLLLLPPPPPLRARGVTPGSGQVRGDEAQESKRAETVA